MRTLYLSDLDGTLLTSKACVSEFTNTVINSIVECDGLFSFATARSEETARSLCAGFNPSAPPILYNGAVTGYAGGETQPVRLHFSNDITDLLLELIDGGVNPVVYSFIDGEEKFSFLRGKSNADMTKFLKTRENCKRYNPVDTFADLTHGENFYITCIDSEQRLAQFNEKYKGVHHCVFQKDIYTGCQWLEIMPKNSTKANAALSLKKRLGCDELVVFGDNKNDIELFKIADRCYAVANAVEELKAIATAVIQSNDEDGVARFLQKEFNLM